jgi:hypothetical protein
MGRKVDIKAFNRKRIILGLVWAPGFCARLAILFANICSGSIKSKLWSPVFRDNRS